MYPAMFLFHHVLPALQGLSTAAHGGPLQSNTDLIHLKMNVDLKMMRVEGFLDPGP